MPYANSKVSKASSSVPMIPTKKMRLKIDCVARIRTPDSVAFARTLSIFEQTKCIRCILSLSIACGCCTARVGGMGNQMIDKILLLSSLRYRCPSSWNMSIAREKKFEWKHTAELIRIKIKHLVR